jgi:mRNA interferase MazF
MAITSRIKPSSSFGEVMISEWETAGLIKPSVIKPIFTTIEKGLVIRKMGTLHEKDHQVLKRALQTILG